ncbi:NUDIX domain-containing protein [Novosphingobium sp.]|uniref:NUDIX domain-containing protein n=1 Tax=Novosphingobium sp. TaxID=1874826 RepID=UPI002FDB3963
MRRRKVEGVRVLAFDACGRILLVRHSYGSGTWMPPSGGLRRGEDPLGAAVRELREETGCALLDPRLLAVTEEYLQGAVNRVHAVIGATFDRPQADGREIVQVGFFACDALPEPMSMRVSEYLQVCAVLR